MQCLPIPAALTAGPLQEMIADSIILNDTFRFEAGGALDGMTVVFHKSMDEYDGKTRVLWICHALTANSDAEEWWPQLVGPGKLFDTEKYFVVCVNVPGSPYGTTGPSSIDPSTGKPYFLTFPKITVRDMVRAMIEVRKHLGIRQIDLLIGSSIGGFQAVEWAVMEPGSIRNLVLMATDVRVSPWMTAWCESQRMALEADQTFREAASLEGGDAGMRCARAQALISYRSYEGYCRTQSEPDPDTLFAERAASYQRYQGEKLSRRFDAYSYYYLCNALDSHNVGRGRGGVGKTLSAITAQTTVITIDSDFLFPAAAMQRWAPLIPGARCTGISSAFGHDGFLLEKEQVEDIIGPVIAGLSL